MRSFGHTASEYAAAVLCHTQPFFGTTHLGQAAGLMRCGLTPRIHARTTWAELVAAQKPLLASTIICGSVLHVVAVLDADEAGVAIHDPLNGSQSLSRKEFEAQWTGLAISVR